MKVRITSFAFCSIFTVLSLAFFAACSVNYDDMVQSEEFVPELMLDEASFSRTERGRTTTQISSDRLEEFKDNGKVLAEKIQFETKNDDGKTTAMGNAGIMCADTKNELYEFYDGINLETPERGVKISAESLKWNGKTEQLTSERGKPLSITKDGITLSGDGFSASAISETFNFASSVSGNYRDEDSADEE